MSLGQRRSRALSRGRMGQRFAQSLEHGGCLLVPKPPALVRCPPDSARLLQAGPRAGGPHGSHHEESTRQYRLKHLCWASGALSCMRVSSGAPCCMWSPGWVPHCSSQAQSGAQAGTRDPVRPLPLPTLMRAPRSGPRCCGGGGEEGNKQCCWLT